MSWKEKRLYSILNGTCPVCHEGKVFKYKKVFHPTKFDKMYDRCDRCGHKYEIETGFFYGAMYVSYALTVAISVATFVITHLIYSDTPYWVYIINILVVLVLMAPITFRSGRLIWINLFNSYRPEAIEEYQKKKEK